MASGVDGNVSQGVSGYHGESIGSAGRLVSVPRDVREACGRLLRARGSRRALGWRGDGVGGRGAEHAVVVSGVCGRVRTRPTWAWSICGPPTGGRGASIVPTLVGLAHVKRVASWDVPNNLTVRPDGTPTVASVDAQAGGVFAVVSPNGLFTKQDRVTVVQGRMLDPTRADEAVASAVAARALGLHVGDVTRQGFYTDAQSNSPDFGTAKIRPVFIQAVKVVGIVKFNNEVVQDDIDRLPTYVVLSPALARRLAQCCGAGGMPSSDCNSTTADRMSPRSRVRSLARFQPRP